MSNPTPRFIICLCLGCLIPFVQAMPFSSLPLSPRYSLLPEWYCGDQVLQTEDDTSQSILKSDLSNKNSAFKVESIQGVLRTQSLGLVFLFGHRKQPKVRQFFYDTTGKSKLTNEVLLVSVIDAKKEKGYIWWRCNSCSNEDAEIIVADSPMLFEVASNSSTNKVYHPMASGIVALKKNSRRHFEFCSKLKHLEEMAIKVDSLVTDLDAIDALLTINQRAKAVSDDLNKYFECAQKIALTISDFNHLVKLRHEKECEFKRLMHESIRQFDELAQFQGDFISPGF